MKNLKIFLAQMNFLLGDIHGNTQKIITWAQKARDQGGQVVVFPELAITGYPPEDLLLRPKFIEQVQQALQLIQHAVPDIHIIVGHPEADNDSLLNAASVFYQNQRLACYAKQLLPNYRVFDEKRYFKRGHTPCVIDIHGINVGIVICEDLWHPGPARQTADAGAELILSLNASPFYRKKIHDLPTVLQARCQEAGVPIAYVNNVGGQDELVFDGGSLVLNAKGKITQRLPLFTEVLTEVTPQTLSPIPSDEQHVYDALVMGTHDYVRKNGFKDIFIGLSGGIDSTLTLAIAVDALGPDHVHAIMMPSRYTSHISIEDSEQLVKNLGVNYQTLSIEQPFDAFLNVLKPSFKKFKADATEENIQARCRGVLLMALANKYNGLVLTTGNKSEMAVGYATLYGDMAGGFAVLKDVPKTLVYQLAHFRNRDKEVIPQRIITRPPSAELAENQTDQDSLPPYDELDAIMAQYVEHDASIADMIAQGHDEANVRHVVKRIDMHEYKRRQAPPGIRISQRAFGRDWRYPITSGYNEDAL